MSSSTEPARIPVTAEQPYEVLVGYGLLAEVPALLGSGVQRVALLHPPTMIKTAERLSHELSAAGLEPVRVDLPDGEAAKSVAVAERCWSILGNAGFTRSDAVVGLGGGATTDLAGFVAATWLRGIRMIMVPTTLLGMVDAAVGGKTGINTAEGKNLVGCFYEPVSVICDLDALATLPTADLIAGLAEVIKCGFIADPVILTMIESDPAVALRADSAMLRELVERAVSVKAAVVSADLRESTSTGSAVGRELLNYGHTIGHAIERRESFTWRHGNAISVGMVYAAELARLAGRLDHETANRHRVVLSQVGLPTTYAADAFDDLLHTMALDKKARGSTLRFVILNGLASAEILAAPVGGSAARGVRRSCGLVQCAMRRAAATTIPARAQRQRRGHDDRSVGRAQCSGNLCGGGSDVRGSGTSYPGGSVERSRAGGVGSARSDRAHVAVPCHSRDLPGSTGRHRGGAHAGGVLRRHSRY